MLPAKEPSSKFNHDSEQNTPCRSNPRRKVLPIEDARRIWGTLKSTTTFAVSSVIKHLTLGMLAENITVKRKYKVTQESNVKEWWFVLRSDKSKLQLLEEEWLKVATQTGWKLEPAYCYYYYYYYY